MRKYFKMTATILGIVLIFSMAGCNKKRELNCPEFLTEKSWMYENSICGEHLSFGKDGNFSYYESCGNPVGNSDMYEEYTYEEETGIITVYPYESGMEEMQMEVIRYDENNLLLKIDDRIKEFCIDGSFPYLDVETGDYTLGYSSYEAVLKLEGDYAVTAPASYDADVPSQKELQRKEKLAENVKYFELSVETVETEEETISTHEYHELSENEVESLLEGTQGMGFVWYSRDMEIEKIVFFGETIIYE